MGAANASSLLLSLFWETIPSPPSLTHLTGSLPFNGIHDIRWTFVANSTPALESRSEANKPLT
jgi:hypothetical protein